MAHLKPRKKNLSAQIEQLNKLAERLGGVSTRYHDGKVSILRESNGEEVYCGSVAGAIFYVQALTYQHGA